MTDEERAQIPADNADSTTDVVKMVEKPPADPDEGDEGEGEAPQQPAAAAKPGARSAAPKNGKPDWRNIPRAELFRRNTELHQQNQQFSMQMERMRLDTDRKIDEIRRQYGGGQQKQEGAQATDPLETEIADVRRQIGAHLKLSRTDKDYDGWEDMAALNERLLGLKAQQILDKRDKARPQQQGDGRDPRVAAAEGARYEQLTGEFPWMLHPAHGERLTTLVGIQYRYLLAQGRGDSLATHREAAARVARDHNIGAAPVRGNPRAPTPRNGYQDGDGAGQGPREVEVPRAALQGHGLSEERVRRAIFGKD